MSQLCFIDTNIVVYANDGRDPEKQIIAQNLLKKLIPSNQAAISSQVLQEFCNVMLKGDKPFMRLSDLRVVLLEVLLPIMRHSPDATFYVQALDLINRHSLGWYDSLIVQAAVELHCDVLYTEDLQDGQQFGKLKVVNPFNT